MTSTVSSPERHLPYQTVDRGARFRGQQVRIQEGQGLQRYHQGEGPSIWIYVAHLRHLRLIWRGNLEANHQGLRSDYAPQGGLRLRPLATSWTEEGLHSYPRILATASQLPHAT